MVDPPLALVLAYIVRSLLVFSYVVYVSCCREPAAEGGRDVAAAALGLSRSELQPWPEPQHWRPAVPTPVLAATGPSHSDAWPESRHGSPAAQAPEPVVVEKPQLGYFRYSTAAAAAKENCGVRGAAVEVCPICLEALEDGDECSEVPACRHVYCRECIALWMRSHSTCPLCRGLIAPGSEPLSAAEENV